MAVREASIAIVALALLATSVQAGLFTPADDVLRNPAVSAEETTTDVTGECDGALEVGAAAIDISPYDPKSWAEPWEDLDGDGLYDGPQPTEGNFQGEPYVDENGNGKFDALFMAGYGHDPEDNEYYMAEGVHDPVWARALAITCGETTLGIVSVDTVGLFSNAVDEIRDRASESFDHVLVASTHTHDSIDTMGLWGPNILTDGKHPALMERYKGDTANALDKALATQETVADTYVASERTRDLIDAAGTLQTDLRDPFVIDDRILAARFVDEEGDTIATLVNWSPHPETLAGTDSRISSDYAHYLREAIESEGATVDGEHHEPIGGTAVFFSGAVGGMMTTLGADPITEDDRTLSAATYEKAERIGEVAAWAALDSLQQAQPTTIDGLDVQAREVSVPSDNPFIIALNTIGVFDHPLAVGPAEVPPLGPTGVVAPIPFFRAEMNTITLDSAGEPALQTLTAPGELLPEVALGNPLDHEKEATPENCWAYNPTKELFNHDREKRPNPDAGGEEQVGYERQLASNPDQPKEPAFLQMSEAEHVMLFGLANDELGYIVPADDYVYPTAAPSVYGQGRDRCGEGDHYEETVSASSYLAPAVADTLAEMIDPAFTPEPRPTAVAGPTNPDDAPTEPTSWEVDDTHGVWVDTSRSGGYEPNEDAHVRVGLPSGLSGCWGFLNGHLEAIGQNATQEVRGLWIDLDGDCEHDEGDGVVFADMWALSEGQPRWRP